MSRRDVITHYGAYLYRREDYLGICDGIECAAQLLDLFEFWTAGRLNEIKQVESYNRAIAKQGGTQRIKELDLWLYETVADFQDGLLGSFSDISGQR